MTLNFNHQTLQLEIEHVHSCKYLGVKLHEKWSWKFHIRDQVCKVGHRLFVFNQISLMLDKKFRVAHFNDLVLPHLSHADMVWGDQQGLKSEMGQLQSHKNRFAKKIQGGNQSSADALKSLNWLPLAA